LTGGYGFLNIDDEKTQKYNVAVLSGLKAVGCFKEAVMIADLPGGWQRG
jgi:hypothetical protein